MTNDSRETAVPYAVTRKVIQDFVGGCREEDEHGEKCWAPAEFILWGKLVPPDGLGPRCYDHAAKHVGHHALSRGSGWALVHLADLADRIDERSDR